jgi:membrane associated rhomboid family serine protease
MCSLDQFYGISCYALQSLSVGRGSRPERQTLEAVSMRRLTPYILGVAAVAGAEYFYVASDGPLDGGHPSGWLILFLFYLAGASGAVGGLLGLVIGARWQPRSDWGLALTQGIVAMLAPFAVVNLAGDLLAANSWLAAIAVCALAGAVGALLSFGLSIAGRAVVRRGTSRA